MTVESKAVYRFTTPGWEQTLMLAWNLVLRRCRGRIVVADLDLPKIHEDEPWFDLAAAVSADEAFKVALDTCGRLTLSDRTSITEARALLAEVVEIEMEADHPEPHRRVSTFSSERERRRWGRVAGGGTPT